MTRAQTPEEAAAETALRQTHTSEYLLRQAYALTHRIHSLGMREGGTPTARAEREQQTKDLRAARALIDAEILRRCGVVRA